MTIVEVFHDGRAADFHGLDWPVITGPHIWHFQPTRSALILGSTQNESLIDVDVCNERHIDVVRRRSGGGVVLLQPDHTVWIDVILPSSHRRWQMDVGQSAQWVGEVFATSLSDLGCGPFVVHSGAMQRSEWSNLVCFAGRGSGEVFDQQGSKVVGISQRRTRQWARFQCAVSINWDPDTLIDLLRPPRPSVTEIAHVGSSLKVSGEDVSAAVIEALVIALDDDSR
jgi:lipoate-protein ligase A